MKTVKRDDLLNGWLKYHNTSVEQVILKHPKEELSSPDWFKLYAVTQDQYDEWEKWAKEYLKKRAKISKLLIARQWAMICLDCAPAIKQ
jgi:hypothetical protein